MHFSKKIVSLPPNLRGGLRGSNIGERFACTTAAAEKQHCISSLLPTLPCMNRSQWPRLIDPCSHSLSNE